MAFLEYRPKSTLFHYCDAKGFKGITDSGAIWLTDLKHANDPKELQLAEVIDRVMGEMLKEETAVRYLKTYVHLQHRLQDWRSRFGFYCFCLSRLSDQLPMWQEYTDRGRGFCIGFRASAFNYMPLRIQQVTYVTPDYFGSLHSSIKEIVTPFVGHENNFLKEIAPMTRIATLITSVKDNTWVHEDEVRLLFSQSDKPADINGLPIPVSLLPDGTEVHHSVPLTRVRNGIEVPYFMKPFGRIRSKDWDATRAISHVIIGPNNGLSVAEVTDTLRSKGCTDFEVTKSRCAFRP